MRFALEFYHIAQGAYETKIATAKKMLEDKIACDKVVIYTGLPLKDIKKLAQEVDITNIK